MIRKMFKVLMLMIAMLIIPSVNALVDFDVQKVEVNDIVVTEDGEAVFAERGSNLIVEVFVVGKGFTDDARVRATIGGYEFGLLEDTSEIFEIEPNVLYRKILKIPVPEDIEASDDYTLDVEVFDDDNRVDIDLTLRIQERRHFINIFDVITRPSAIEAGRALFTLVRLENLGQKKEENIKLTVSIPELGVSASDFIDELVSEVQEIEFGDDDEEESSITSNELILRIPENAITGNYVVVVTVEFNRGHSVISETRKVFVQGVSPLEQRREAREPLVSFDQIEKDAAQGETTVFLARVANLDTKSNIYSVEVTGERLFGIATVSPSFLNIRPEGTGEFRVGVKPNEETASGTYNFIVKVKRENDIIEERTLTLNVGREERPAGIGVLGGVLIGIIVFLAVAAVVLGVMIYRQRDERENEAPINEGVSYYYYPKQ